MTIIDVSYFNGAIDWQRIRAAGVTQARIRGPIYDRWVDDSFQTNWQMALQADIARRGVYCIISRLASASTQVLNILRQTDYDFGTEPVVLDIERTNAERSAIDAGTLVWDKQAYTQLIHEIVAGLQPVVPVELYTSKREWLSMTTNPAWAVPLPHWIAHYNPYIQQPDVPDGWLWHLWQYQQTSIDGISGLVDVNREQVTVQSVSAGLRTIASTLDRSA